MERLTYRDSGGRALLTNKGMKIYCSTQATADVLCRYEEIIDADKPEFVRCKDCTYRGEINCPQYYRRTELSDNYFCADVERQ